MTPRPHFVWLSQWEDGAQADFGSGAALSSDQLQARGRLRDLLNRDILWLVQNHGTEISTWSASGVQIPDAGFSDIAFVDATVSETPNLDSIEPAQADLAQSDLAPAAAVVTADCVPVLIAANTKPIWAAVHAGRRGIQKGILQKAIDEFVSRGVQAADLSVAIGPSVCGQCYQVDKATADQWFTDTGSYAEKRGDAFYLDLPGYCEDFMRQSVKDCTRSDVCTLENENYPSYRRDQTKHRLASLVWLGQDVPRVGRDLI